MGKVPDGDQLVAPFALLIKVFFDLTCMYFVDYAILNKVALLLYTLVYPALLIVFRVIDGVLKTPSIISPPTCIRLTQHQGRRAQVESNFQGLGPYCGWGRVIAPIMWPAES